MEAICRNALAILDCQLFFNFLVVPEVNRLRLNACAGISAADAENIEWLDFGSAICGCVASDSCRVVAEDIQNTTDERAALVRSYGVKAYACHPLLRAETVIGTLSFGSFNKICFTEEELRLMKAITDMVAIAMERKRIEESLLRAKREWEMTFDSLPDLISIIDDQYRILRVNRPMARFLGRNPQDCIGMHCFAEMHGGDAPLCNCPHEQALIDHQTHEIEIYDEAGERTYLVSATPLQMDDGRLIGSVHIARDITAQKRAELVLKQSHEILEEMIDERTDQLKDTIHVLQCEVLEREKTQKSLEFEMSEKLQIMESLREQEKLLILQSRQAAMGEMIGNIAHQWRQPLNILGLHLQQLGLYHEAGKFNTEYLHESIRKGMGIIQHMSKTIDDFRNFFCPEKEIKLFSLQETISNAVAIISDSFASHTITINVCNEPDLEVLGFANEFSQALLNILLNAKDVLLERQTEQPIITLQVEKTADKAVISIKDNAGGMKEEIIDKIFDPYFTTKGPQQGTGLGLYMAKMIIEKNMGGRLTARNNADGAEFCIEVNQAA